MKTYFNINIFGRKLILRKDNNGSITLGLIKENPLPKIGRKALEELDNNLCNDQEKVRELIIPLYSRGQYNNDDITVSAIQNLAKVAATSPAEDISELIYTNKSMSEEEKEYYRGWVKKAEKEIEANKKELEHIKNKQSAYL
jgi:hypothetical protein